MSRIVGNLIPDSTVNARDIGSSSNIWKNLYVNLIVGIGNIAGIRIVDGVNFTTIQAAYDDAGVNGTTLVPPGTYNLSTTGITVDNRYSQLIFSPGVKIQYSGTAAAITVTGGWSSITGYPQVELTSTNAASCVLVSGQANQTLRLGDLTSTAASITTGQYGLQVDTDSGNNSFLIDAEIAAGDNLDILCFHNGPGGGNYYKVRATNGGNRAFNKVMEINAGDANRFDILLSAGEALQGLDFVGAANANYGTMYFEGKSTATGITFSATSTNNYVLLSQQSGGTFLTDNSAAGSDNVVHDITRNVFMGSTAELGIGQNAATTHAKLNAINISGAEKVFKFPNITGELDVAHDIVATGEWVGGSPGNTTPTVLAGNWFKEANTGATAISAFDDAINGQTITILFTTGNTTITDGSNLNLSGGADFTGSADDILTLRFDGTKWYEISRSVN